MINVHHATLILIDSTLICDRDSSLIRCDNVLNCNWKKIELKLKGCANLTFPRRNDTLESVATVATLGSI
jgi:hypothetical protein